MTLTQLNYVVTVSRMKSINAASKVLFISQSSLSASIRDLETELGILIFHRSSRGIIVTDEGAEFIRYAQNILMQVNMIRDRYAGNKEEKTPFSISMHHSTFGTTAFADVIRKYGVENYEFSLFETKTEEVIRNVKTARSEIGLLFLSDFNQIYYDKIFRDQNLEYSGITDFSVYAYVGRQHPLADRDRISVKELESYPCLIFDQDDNSGSYFYEEMVSAYQYKNVILTSDRATTMGLLTKINAYSVGIGVAGEGTDEEKSDVIAVRLDTDEKIRLGLIKRKEVPLSAPAKDFISEFSTFAKKAAEETK